jgi:hypothetical protein
MGAVHSLPIGDFIDALATTFDFMPPATRMASPGASST